MKAVLVVFALWIGVNVAQAQNKPPATLLDTWRNPRDWTVPMQSMRDWTMPGKPEWMRDWFTIPPLPDLSLPDVTQIVMAEFNSFTQQLGDTLPLLEEMGYEVSTFRVQWALPPRAKLRLRSKNVIDPAKLEAITAKATGGMLMKALVFSASTAKRIQRNMKLGTAVIDVDFAAPPKIRMSFLSAKTDRKDPAERDVEDIDLACGQALAAN